ncbi:MAG: amidohydrolase [Gammaproteobacteria bacterium]|nr:MAG: amidohydrolase [Gammaproteobacteria bacterium]TLZ62349.1 MAG: amidohydrolase [Gammaproteobacteria bacterium]
MAGLRVSLVQQPLAWHDPPANRAHFQTLLEGLAGRTDLVVLPETFTTGFSMKVQELGEPAAGPTTAWLTGLAARLDAAITGSLITEEGGRYYNRLLWVAPSGAPRHYDKRHLFRMGREHQHFTPGRAAWSVPWRGLRVCPLVCYDLRFPVFSRRRAELDYELLLYVANWPAARADAWRQLLRARAIENQTYVVGVNRVGEDGHGVPHAGDSAAIDFLGRPLAEAGGVPAVITVELERAPLDAYREKFPAHLDGDRFTLEL